MQLFRKDPEDLPPTSRLLALLLSNQIQDFDSRILAQLQEIIHTYTLQILQESAVLQQHSGNPTLTTQDVKLAIEFKSSIEYTSVPSKTALVELAKKKNSIPLPLVTEKFGLRLPPERHCLIKRNISIIPKKRARDESSNQVSVQNTPMQPALHAPSMASMMKAAAPQPVNTADDDDYDMDGILN